MCVYRCRSDGTCACFDGYFGPFCNITAPRECNANADCGPGRMCDRGTGMCMCAGDSCETCGCGEYPGDKDKCSAATCDVDATCNTNGRCGKFRMNQYF